MRKFLNKVVIYFILLGLVVGLFITVIFFKPELVDNFYRRFTTDKANSLILGTSRAAQGIKPSVINEIICTDKNKIINHSFAVGPSSIGPNYYREITQKLKKNTTNGIFIISVDPWSIATTTENIDDDSLKFFEVETELFVGNLTSSSVNPNFDYLYKYWNNRFSPFGNGFKELINYEGLLYLHKDGWLEVNLNMDSIPLNNRIRKSTNEYREKGVYLSETRFYYLEKIINYLDSKGEIFFIRLPVSPGMAELEHERFPEFDEIMNGISKKHQRPYFNFISESGNYQTIDTHHLHQKESERITYRICDSISNYMN